MGFICISFRMNESRVGGGSVAKYAPQVLIALKKKPCAQKGSNKIDGLTTFLFWDSEGSKGLTKKPGAQIQKSLKDLLGFLPALQQHREP